MDRTTSRRRVLRWTATAAGAGLLPGAGLAWPGAGGTAAAQTSQAEADLAAVKAYVVEQATEMKKGTSALLQTATEYHELILASASDYAVAWSSQQATLKALVQKAQEQWLQASVRYEMAEGLVAGVPSLSYFDTWIDAGPSGAEDPANALDWEITLPDGQVLEKPGNFMQHLTEPVLWGTVEEYVGLRVDFDGNGEQGLGEVLPEANILLGGATGLDAATSEMQTAIAEWEPTIEDTFTALTTMIPTMNEYFEQWKNSVFVSGDAARETSFVATSRLSDVSGILNGLDLTYDEISPLVAAANPGLHAQIDTGFADLVGFVQDLFTQESGGKSFTPAEADLYGGEAQERATALVGQVSQAIALLGIQV